jgi:hypothetical protein
MYGVDLWLSNPEEGNDDLITGLYFETLEEAQAAFTFPGLFFGPDLFDAAYLELCRYGEEDGHKTVFPMGEKKNPLFCSKADRDDDWKLEVAMQAGMGLGVQGYNDALY